MLYGACLLSQKVAIEKFRNFAISDMLALQENIRRFSKQDASFQPRIIMLFK